MSSKMKKVKCLAYLSTFVLYALLITVQGMAGNSKELLRPKRFLSFNNNTKFFMRLNFKANMVPWSQIFAQALGFRMNFDEPPNTFHPYHKLYRRSLYQGLEMLFDRHGLDGLSCVRRAICESYDLKHSTSIYKKILKLLFGMLSSPTKRWHWKHKNDCDVAIQICPFSILDLVNYTDL